MTISEKVAYIKGLAEGLKIDERKDEGKITKAIIDVLEDMAISISDLEEGFDDVNEELDAINEDLDELMDEDTEETFYTVVCPKCGEEVNVDEDLLNDGWIDCPKCGERLEFDIEEDECGCDDCCCGEDKHE